MRVSEILGENWWKDLDGGFLTMMGYAEDDLQDQIVSDTAEQVARDAQAVRQARQR